MFVPQNKLWNIDLHRYIPRVQVQDNSCKDISNWNSILSTHNNAIYFL